MVIYLVVNETGQYSDYRKECLAAFHDRSEAEAWIEENMEIMKQVTGFVKGLTRPDYQNLANNRAQKEFAPNIPNRRRLIAERTGRYFTIVHQEWVRETTSQLNKTDLCEKAKDLLIKSEFSPYLELGLNIEEIPVGAINIWK